MLLLLLCACFNFALVRAGLHQAALARAGWLPRPTRQQMTAVSPSCPHSRKQTPTLQQCRFNFSQRNNPPCANPPFRNPRKDMTWQRTLHYLGPSAGRGGHRPGKPVRLEEDLWWYGRMLFGAMWTEMASNMDRVEWQGLFTEYALWLTLPLQDRRWRQDRGGTF